MFYMDVYLFVHFIFEYMLLKSVQMIRRESKGNLRIMLGAAFTALSNGLLLICPIPQPLKQLLTYVLVTVMEIRITFGIKKGKEFIKIFILLYFLAFCMGGCLEWIFENTPVLKKHGYSILTLSAAIFFLYAFIKKSVCMIKENLFQGQCKKEVCLHINGKRICCVGLLDTGNSLIDPITQKPVLILQRNELEKNHIKINKEQYRVIPYHSIGKKSGILEGFIADEVYIREKNEKGDEQTVVRQKMVIGIYEGKLSRDDSYQMILHPMV